MSTSRLLAGAVFAAFAAVVPVFAASGGASPVITSSPDNCLAWLGARGSGQCISESNGNGPAVGFNGAGIETGPWFPGTSVNIPLG